MRRTRLGALLWPILAVAPLAAQESTTPVEKADDLTWKATASVYVVGGEAQGDLNLRHKLGDVTGWVGAFLSRHDDPVGRLGAEYDFQRKGVLVVPTFQTGTNGLLAGQLYMELGDPVYAIAGFSRTNLKPLFSLSFDPNESVQLGAGWHVTGFDRVFAFTIFDVRLGTGQQDTHLLYRRKLDAKDGLTLDVLYKSGHLDDGRFVRGWGVGLYWDRPTWFVKAYWDPYVNFTADDMVRIGAGLKF